MAEPIAAWEPWPIMELLHRSLSFQPRILSLLSPSGVLFGILHHSARSCLLHLWSGGDTSGFGVVRSNLPLMIWSTPTSTQFPLLLAPWCDSHHQTSLNYILLFVSICDFFCAILPPPTLVKVKFGRLTFSPPATTGFIQ